VPTITFQYCFFASFTKRLGAYGNDAAIFVLFIFVYISGCDFLYNVDTGTCLRLLKGVGAKVWTHCEVSRLLDFWSPKMHPNHIPGSEADSTGELTALPDPQAGGEGACCTPPQEPNPFLSPSDLVSQSHLARPQWLVEMTPLLLSCILPSL